MRSIPRILKITHIKGYEVSCLFSNGESRIIDFMAFFQKQKLVDNHPPSVLLNDYKEFEKIEIIGNTIGWKNVGRTFRNIDGTEQFYYFDLDPIVLYEFSKPDQAGNLQIGQLIRSERKKAGISQEELAKRSGTTKHYISRLENDKSDIELLTLKKIIEAGFGQVLKIEIVSSSKN